MKRSLKLGALTAVCLAAGSVAAVAASGGTTTTPYTMCVAKNGTITRPTGSTCSSGQTKISVANGDDVAALATRVNGAEGNIDALSSANASLQAVNSSQSAAVASLSSQVSDLNLLYRRLYDIEYPATLTLTLSDPAVYHFTGVHLAEGSLVTLYWTDYLGQHSRIFHTAPGPDGAYQIDQSASVGDCAATDVYVTGYSWGVSTPIESNHIASSGC